MIANDWHKTGCCLNKVEYGAIIADSDKGVI